MTRKRGLGCTQQVCNGISVTAGGLYLATHSVAVTALGMTAATVLCGWRMWLAHRGELSLSDGAGPSAATNERGADLGHVLPLQ